ncbi:MAG TPA: sigma-70 family RNA polymerase sigma factor [Nitrospiraceae bacterium]|nr:sigma-70 family RNA polymerase sigma factor [Nitrospiraceae bacterium]
MSKEDGREDPGHRAAEAAQDREERRDGEETRTQDRQPELLVRRLLDQQPEFLGFLRRRLGSEVVAEDLLQQSLVRAVERYHSLKHDESVVPWFYRILRHAVIDYYRSHEAEARRDDAYLRDLVQAGEDQEPAFDELKPSVCACLSRLLPALRPNYAELIRRIDLGGESPQLVAEELNISQNNLTVRLHRARQALKERLEETCGVCTTHGCLHCTCE